MPVLFAKTYPHACIEHTDKRCVQDTPNTSPMQETDLVDLHVARRCDRLKLSALPTVHTTHSFTPVTKGILRRLILAPVSACLAQLDAPSACCRCLMPLHICHRACLHKHSASRLSNAWTNPEGTDEQQRAVVVQILHRPRVQTLCFRGLISCVPFAVPHDRIDRKALISRAAPQISQPMTQMPAASRCPRAEAEMVTNPRL